MDAAAPRVEAVVAEIPHGGRGEAADTLGTRRDALRRQVGAHVRGPQALQPVAKLIAEDLWAAGVEEVIADPGDESQALQVVAEVLAPLGEEVGLGLPVRPRD